VLAPAMPPITRARSPLLHGSQEVPWLHRIPRARGGGYYLVKTRLVGEPALSILNVPISGCLFRGRSGHPSMPRSNDTLNAWMTPNPVAPNGIART
jgi:hypothetical protein